ncbi:MAG: PEGA domain-containing protein [Pseudomonadota bacterium]
MRTRTGFVLWVAMVALISSSVRAADPTPIDKEGVVTRSTKVKDDKDKKFNLKKGQRVEVQYERDNWYWVRTAKGKQAWVKKKYVRLEKATASDATPVVSPKLSPTTPGQPADDGSVRTVSARSDEAALPVSRHGKTKIAVLDLKGTENMSPKLVAFLTGAITETLDALGPFQSLSSTDISRVLEYQARNQLLGCEDASCFAEISAALGAEHLISGEISQVNAMYVVQLRLHDPKTGQVAKRISREYQGEPEALFREVRAAAKMLVRDLLMQKAGTLKLAASEEGATIRVDDVVFGVTPSDPIPVAGGLHALAIEKEGFVVAKQDVEVQEGKTVEVYLKLVPSEEYRRDHRRGAELVRGVALATAGAGVLSLAASGFFFYTGFDKASALQRDTEIYNASEVRQDSVRLDLRDRRQELGVLDVVALGTAGGGLGAMLIGGVIFLLGDDPGKYD